MSDGEHFLKLLKQILKLDDSEARNVFKIVKSEAWDKDLKNMSNDEFLDKAKFVVENNLRMHSPFCSYCLRSFQNRKDRNNHVKMIHENKTEGKFLCELCEKSYMSKTALKYHIDVSHATERQKEVCPTCNLGFGHKISLARHMKIHAETPELHKCKHCDKDFYRKDKLKKHLRIVHREVNVQTKMIKMFKNTSESNVSYKCKICEKVFYGNSALSNMNIHVVEKQCNRLKCNECEKEFSRSDNLEQHKKIVHANSNTTISCEHCGFVTSYKRSLTRHMKTHIKMNK